MIKNNFKSGLKPHRPSRKDYSLKKTFKLGAFDLSTLPPDYFLPSTILTQTGYECTANASCAIREVQAGIRFDPDWFYQAEGQTAGEVSETGYELRVALDTGLKGFRPLTTGEPADKYKESSYFWIDGPFDRFDNIRLAMYAGALEKRCAILGTMWQSEWSNQTIVGEGKTPVGGHALKCAGWKTINGIPYIVIQNSYGEGIGDKGYQYFSREIINKEFTFGQYVWRLKPDNIIRIGILQNILNLLSQWLNLLMKKQEANRQSIQPDAKSIQTPPTPTVTPETAPPRPVTPEIKPVDVKPSYPASWLNFSKADDPLIHSLILKESSDKPHPDGDDSRIGDLNLVDKAYGCLQIRLPAITDVNHAYDTNFKPQDCLNNRELSIYVCKAYLGLWATAHRLGHTPTWEDKARIWNGGPNGWKKSNTEYYWNDILRYYPPKKVA